MITLPKDDIKKQDILQKIAQRFQKDKKYSEKETDAIIKSFDVDDHVLFRRELVNFGYLSKDSYKGQYWIKKVILSREEMDNIEYSQIRRKTKGME